jgi:two-component system, NtrC family, response regulator PilR
LNSDLPNVYVLDDDPEMGRLIQKVLERYDCSVTYSHLPRTALRELLTGKYDVLITDLFLPGKEGLGLLQKIFKEVPKMKVLVMSSYGHTGDSRLALQAGAHQFLPKPLSMDDLQQATLQALDACAEQR